MRNCLYTLFLVFMLFSCKQETKNDVENKDNQTNVVSVEDNKDYENNEVNEIDTLTETTENKETTENTFREESLSAYINDPDEVNPTNVRATPGGEIVLKLPQNDDYMINITGVQYGWFLVDYIYGFGNDSEYEIPNKKAWIHGSVIELGTRNYGSQAYDLLNEPNGKNIIVTINFETFVKLKDIKGDWVQVVWENEGKKYTGWIEKDKLCGNPLTNCC